ncbi:MAG: hypothetical protein ACPHRO_05950, partial [Nannocystaceae bacterium]
METGQGSTRRWVTHALLAMVSVGVAGCKNSSGGAADAGDGETSVSGSASGGTETGSMSIGSSADDGGEYLDVAQADSGSAEGGDGDGDCESPGGDATLTGTVFAPNGVIPVSGALVYLTDAPPDPIPPTVYCAECVDLPCQTSFALTDYDGSFNLSAPSGAGQYLVVEKGQFRRVTALDVSAGSTPVNIGLTTLPKNYDAANGQFIPKIAVAVGNYDRLEDGLAKLGLGDIQANLGGEELVDGTQTFDVWDHGGPSIAGSKGSFAQLLQSPVLMDQYHIIFVPCAADAALSTLESASGLQNVRDWVAKGGKWYVSDWSNEFIDVPFSQYQTFYQEGGSGDLLGVYDSTGVVLDGEMESWLDSLPADLKDINPINGGGGHPTVTSLPSIELVDNWSGIQSVPPVMVSDGMGGEIDVGHKVWVEGPGNGSSVPSN